MVSSFAQSKFNLTTGVNISSALVFVFKMHYIIHLLQFVFCLIASLHKQDENKRYHKRELDHDRINRSFWNYE